jgi:hypothetical protein
MACRKVVFPEKKCNEDRNADLICSMVLVYLPTKLGDFGQGQMLVKIPAPWSIWGWFHGTSMVMFMGFYGDLTSDTDVTTNNRDGI